MRWGTGNGCNGKLICYRDCVLSCLPPFTRSLLILPAAFFESHRFLSDSNKRRFDYLIAPQTKSTCAFIGDASWQLSVLCLLFCVCLIVPVGAAVAFRSLARLCLSVWLMVWNIERCLFLLWLGRQGARWQTTRDHIDYAAFLRSPSNVVIVSGPHCPPGRKPLPALCT